MVKRLGILLIGLMGLQVQAQFAGGATAGLNFCQVDGDTYGGYGKIGLNLGGFVYYNLDERFALQTEILYSVKGARAASFGYHLRLNYIDWPILLNFTLVSNGEQSAILQGGFYTGYLIFAKSGFGVFQDATDLFRKLDVGIAAGATIHATPNLSFFSRFNYSIADILASADPTTAAKWVNKFITIGVRWEWN